jgi:Ca-activated chloride channel homolog
MTFGHPVLLLALLVVPAAVGLYLLAERRRARYAIRFTNVDVLATVAGGAMWRRHVPPLLFLAALAALCVGVARPRAATLVPQERATVVLVIDVSRSMAARDVKPTRLLAAEAAVREFLHRVPKRLRVGLIAFAGTPTLVAPPTTNHSVVVDSLSTVGDYGGYGGTAIGDAVAAAVDVAKQSLAQIGVVAPARAGRSPTRGLVSVLFLSDGSQTNGDLLPLEGAAKAKAAGVPIYTVALGTPGGTLEGNFGGFGGSISVPPDPDTLRAIAETTGGKFYEARSSGAVHAAYASLGSRLGRRRATKEITYVFLAGAAGLLGASALLAAAWAPRLP